MKHLFKFVCSIGIAIVGVLIVSQQTWADKEDEVEDLEYANVEIEMDARHTEDLKASQDLADETLVETYKDIKKAKRKIVNLGMKNDKIKSNIDRTVLELQGAQESLKITEGEVRSSERIVANQEVRLQKVKERLKATQILRQESLQRIQTAQEDIADIDTKIVATKENITQNEKDFINFKKQERALALQKAQRAKQLRALQRKEKLQAEAYSNAGLKKNTMAAE